MRVYLNRFLNVPPVPLPKPKKMENISNETIVFRGPEMLLKELPSLLDKQQQVNQAGQLVVDYLYNRWKARSTFSCNWEGFTA